MGKNSRKRANKRKKSSDSDNNDVFEKAGRYTTSPNSHDTNVSDILSESNKVLYPNDEDHDHSTFFEDNNETGSVIDLSNTSLVSNTSEDDNTPRSKVVNKQHLDMATGNNSDLNKNPSNADIMKCLASIQGDVCSINTRLGGVENRLKSLDKLEKKMDSFDKELKKLWNHIQDNSIKTDQRIEAIEQKTELVDFGLGQTNSKLVELEREKNDMRDELIYLKSQSMRNNLVFVNLPESNEGVEENCEQKVKDFIEQKMKVAKAEVEKLAFDRVHRTGPRQQGKCRKIVARFTEYKQREFVRKQWKALEGTPFSVHEQFPPEVISKRKQLIPRLVAARKDKKKAWLAYDTLYIDGKPVRD